MAGWTRWLLVGGVFGVIVIAPAVHFRYVYAHNKRLREVESAKVYRSGQLTADGFAEAVKRFGLHTIINLQDDHPDPDLDVHFMGGGTIKESELCRQLGVRYVFIAPDLISRLKLPEQRPAAIDQFLAVLDDPDTYPVLWHCRAGLNRTGVMTAIYRMEYNGWDTGAANLELKANGFGEWSSTSANEYINQYVLSFRRGIRCPRKEFPGEVNHPTGTLSTFRSGALNKGGTP
ncbi:MAG: fused DSP-PTPase phosphatase/NAD kinase-like protein [Gemmataceae bacterium]